MKILGLNSPVISLILIIILSILGPQRIEKGWILFQNLLKFLLRNDYKKTPEKEIVDNLKNKEVQSKESLPKEVKKAVEINKEELKKSEAKEVKKAVKISKEEPKKRKAKEDLSEVNLNKKEPNITKVKEDISATEWNKEDENFYQWENWKLDYNPQDL